MELVLEREYFLCQHVPGFTLEGLRQTSSRVLEWFYGRVIRDLQEQQEQIQG